MPKLLILVFVLFTVLVLSASISAAVSRAPVWNLATVGPIRLGVTTTSRLQRVFGAGRITTGHHSDSAVAWRLRGGGCFIADGWHIGKDNGYVIDHMIWTRDRCSTRHSVGITYHGIRLGEEKARVLAILGPRYTEVNSYTEPCLEWRFKRSGTNQPLYVDTSFKQGRLVLLSVSLVDY